MLLTKKKKPGPKPSLYKLLEAKEKSRHMGVEEEAVLELLVENGKMYDADVYRFLRKEFSEVSSTLHFALIKRLVAEGKISCERTGVFVPHRGKKVFRAYLCICSEEHVEKRTSNPLRSSLCQTACCLG